MKHVFSFVATASLAGRVALIAARGRFWELTADEHYEAARGVSPATLAAVSVHAVIPARDEAETIGATVASLGRQRFRGALRTTLVDDRSSDATRERALEAARETGCADRLTIAASRELRAGWTGKLNALETGIALTRAAYGAPAYWLFTDADIVHDPDNVAALVMKARRDDLDLVSLMVRLRCESGWERLLVPAFVFFFAKLYPFAWTADATRSSAAAAGGCVLISDRALERIGGLASIGNELIDDCALARRVKSTGGTLWLGPSRRTTSVRTYDGLGPFWTMVKRTAFTQLDRSYLLTGGTVAAMTLLYLVPPVGTVVGAARRNVRLAAASALAWLAMAFAYRPAGRLYDRTIPETLLLPLSAALYCAMTVDSAVAHARGRGSAWKGRTYGNVPARRQASGG